MDPVITPALITGGATLGAGLINSIGSLIGMKSQANTNKELWDYQWNKAYSPQAQVKNLAAAGINPAVAMGNQSPVFSSGGSIQGVEAPQFGIGTSSLSDLANYINAKSNEKKVGSEVKKNEQEVKVMEADEQAKRFENDLNRMFGASDRTASLALAWKNVLLAQDTHDLNEQNKAINEFKKAGEKALAESNEYQRDILKKVLDNKDEEIRLSNRVLQTQGDSNLAVAEAHHTQADVNRENRRIQAALADIEENSKSDKLQALLAQYHKDKKISDADYLEAKIKLDRLSDIEDKRSNKFFEQVDNYSEWLKSKVKIFSK